MLTSIKNQFLLDFLYENLSNSDKNNSIFAKSDKISFFLIFYTQKLQNYLTSLFKSLSVSSDLLWKLPPPPISTSTELRRHYRQQQQQQQLQPIEDNSSNLDTTEVISILETKTNELKKALQIRHAASKYIYSESKN